MLRASLNWLGFGSDSTAVRHAGHGHAHGRAGGHGHTHGVVDPTIATTARGIWAIKWSFIILAITSALQLAVVFATGSVALLADTIHNIGDAVTAIPLWIAFRLARRPPTLRFTYGLGRVEDLAGITIVAIILFSAVFAGYEAINRLINPQPITLIGWVAAAGVIGFIGNEAVAVFRIRVGREINSAALIADGYHARTDGLTSLAVVAGAAGVWAGFPLADPIVGLFITIAIFGIVWQSSKAVFTRLLDGVEPGVIAEITHAAEHVGAVRNVLRVRARWLGHRLTTELDVAVAGSTTLREAEAISAEVEAVLADHVPALATAHVRVRPEEGGEVGQTHAGHHHAPDPVPVHGELADGMMEIIDTPEGERFRFTATRMVPGAEAVAIIDRPGGATETLCLAPAPGNALSFTSDRAPAEPHQFTAHLRVQAGSREELLAFSMSEPDGHAH